jgi:asparagine synthase (glutamine-hydrolysing)
MCGISGVLLSGHSTLHNEGMLRAMNASQAHRGPDHDGAWIQGDACLGHRRLSIIDLSESGNQPLASTDGRYQIVYNGELYNFRELKLELQRSAQGSASLPYFFKTSTDTEVVLAAFIRWGTGCLRRFQGMFAFAVYDTETRKLFVARDRFGVKPLYYYYGDEGFVFASELRAILKSGIRTFTPNSDAVSEYLMYQTVHAPNTIVKGIRMLEPGHYIEYENGRAAIFKYYDINEHLQVQESDYKSICSRIRDLLAHAVQKRLVSDVPFGAFLSGGIDSSAVVGLMSLVSTQQVRTFNVSFGESEFSEARYARLIARKFNTVHEEILLTPSDFLAKIPDALRALDHPSGDGPNTYVVAEATKRAGITMALSGVGGDELFAGYDVFRRLHSLHRWSWLNAFPQPSRKLAGYFYSMSRRSGGAARAAEVLALEKISVKNAYPYSRSLFTRREHRTFSPSSNDPAAVGKIAAAVPVNDNYVLSAISRLEMSTYLQNILLRDTDQMGMAVALEVREPFLDHQLVEYVLGVPDKHKYPHTPKKLLTDSLGELLPPEVIHRPKMGFTLPWAHWMKNELKGFCERHMQSLATRSYFNGGAVTGLWSRFLNGDPAVPWSRVWHLVVLEHWLNEHFPE